MPVALPVAHWQRVIAWCTCVRSAQIHKKGKEITMKTVLTAAALTALLATPAGADEYLGNYSANPYNANSTSNPHGAGSPYNANSVRNPYGQYGSPYSAKSATNPYTTNAPKLYDRQGNYRGKLSNNPYDADSVSNPYGRYGSPYSSDSINNPFGAGSP